MSTHVMIDLETFGTGNSAVIISIGAVKFDPYAGPNQQFDGFYQAIDPASCEGVGLRMDVSTIMWWMQPEQSKPLQSWLAEPKVDIGEVLDGFATWYGPESMPTWGNGPTFDLTILTSAFTACGYAPYGQKQEWLLHRPWAYKHERCYRTIRALLPQHWNAPEPPDGLAHNAFYDAKRQAMAVAGIVETLGLTL